MDYGISGILTFSEAGQTIALISILLSFVSAMVRKATVDMDKVKDSREKMKEHQKKMQEAQKKGDTDQMLRSQEEMTKHMMVGFKQNFKPMLITWIPVILIFNWISTQYGSAGDVGSLLGMNMNWFWWYLLCSVFSSMIINKIVQVS
ncbi:MAG: EMC3/TMCO1 family protein [Candidatus Altiarchaeia archaeon]